MNEHHAMNRRRFLQTASCAAGLAAGLGAQGAAVPENPAQTVLPRWRGFNLHYFFGTWNDGNPVEDDFRLIADLGFNFVRIPMWYTLWVEGGDVYKVKEPVLAQIDKTVEWGRKYGLHVCLNLHRAPGYCVAETPAEPFNLWKDQAALDAFCFHWDLFAKRYKAIPDKELSFNLLNEPSKVSHDDHERVVRAAVKTIRATSPERLIITDGLMWASSPMPELKDLGIAQSCRGYQPHTLTHYKASWMPGADQYPVPVWPNIEYMGQTWGRQQLERAYAPWGELARQGIGVHCGECGCFNQTPHDVVLAWFRDVLEILTGYNIGYALWEFRGTFGILDSQRKDVTYEDWNGHQLDRKLLKLLIEF
jgi:endoglucanase